MKSTTDGLMDMNNIDHETKGLDQEDGDSVFNSQVVEERNIHIEEEEANLQSVQLDDPKEVELRDLKRLFDKLKLLTELEDYEEIKQYYEEGDAKNEQFYEEIVSLEKELEEAKERKNKAKEDLQTLKKKVKTTEEYIAEDTTGYRTAVRYIYNCLENDCEL